MISFIIPIRLRCGPNSRLHWRVFAKRKKEERAFTRMWAPFPSEWQDLRCEGERFQVTLTRVAPRPVDSDNVWGLCKHVRDEVAALLGIDDGDARVEWLCKQAKDGRQYAVRVDIVALPVASARQTAAKGPP